MEDWCRPLSRHQDFKDMAFAPTLSSPHQVVAQPASQGNGQPCRERVANANLWKSQGTLLETYAATSLLQSTELSKAPIVIAHHSTVPWGLCGMHLPCRSGHAGSRVGGTDMWMEGAVDDGAPQPEPSSCFRKIGIHRTSFKDAYPPDHSDTDKDDHVKRPENTPRALSEPSTKLLDKLSEYTVGHGNHQRKASNADSSYPGEEATSITTTGSTDLHTTDFDQLGLHLVYDKEDALGDLIFVHGLGGSAIKTWSWKRDTAKFWPAWLSDDEKLHNFRVFTFGYNSNFKGSGTNLNITDFAKDLLFHLLTFSQADSKAIGGRPIAFIAHSMGGLVVKKAYIVGKHDPEFSDIVSQVYGIVFLATPHRGSQYAKVLNNILSTAPMGAPPKAYVASLDSQSEALQDINEQFRIRRERVKK
ncbi:MAG: hypothetical protein Q9224_001802 [Gallowayella concinna]